MGARGARARGCGKARYAGAAAAQEAAAERARGRGGTRAALAVHTASAQHSLLAAALTATEAPA
ncbi:MAG: hypothetical protein EOO65_00500 [Methanosarcinales archaeon]|nr:MAG: hypothetical protein EOO65_00500 [Methanosarcinales archaeon]